MRSLAPDSEYFAFLDALRDSGEVNTVLVATYLVREFPGLRAEEARAISGLDLRVCGKRDLSMDGVVDLAEDVMRGCDKGLVVLCGADRIAETGSRDSCWIIHWGISSAGRAHGWQP